MKYIDLTLHTPAENLAFDEALLDACEDESDGEVLRFWEPREHFVVLGYSNKHREEVDLEACGRLGIPVLRRSTGGGTVLQGPGCLNFALVLHIQPGGPLSTIYGANAYILEKNLAGLGFLKGPKPERSGQTDLVMNDLKFSGNAQRRKRDALLFHGTFLYALDIGLVQQVLPIPSRQPAYRRGRRHEEFLANLPAQRAVICRSLQTAWGALDSYGAELPLEKTRELAKLKYQSPGWTCRV